MFYSMHKQLGTILQMPDNHEKKNMIKIAVYTHRLIMAAEQLKQDISLGKIQWPHINIQQHFQEIWVDIEDNFDSSVVQEYFAPMFAIMIEANKAITNKKLDTAQKKLSLFKTALEPVLQG